MTDNTVLMKDLTWCVIDTETTGLSPDDGARVIELAMMRVENGEITDVYTTLLNPHGDVGATEIHRIEQHMVETAPDFVEVADAVTARLQGCVVVGHNITFDWKFMQSEYARCGLEAPPAPLVCTLEGAREHLDIPRHKLGLCAEHLGIDLTGWHAAEADTRACVELCKVLLDRAEAKGRGRLARREWFNQVIPVGDLPTALAVTR